MDTFLNENSFVDLGVTDDVTGQVKDKMFDVFTEVPADGFVVQNGDLRRIRQPLIGII